MTTPKNTSGLKPFQKGQSGNPGGRPKKYVEAEKQRLISYAEFVGLIQKFSEMDRDSITAYLSRKEATMFELIYGKMVVDAAKGDKSARDMLTERLFGKVKEQVENINHNIDHGPPTYVVEMSDGGKFMSQRPQLLKAGNDDE